jgi:uncharacterized protein (TIGR00369 family)
VSFDLESFRDQFRGRLPELFGLELVEAVSGRSAGRIDLREEHMAPNDFLHAGTVIALADTCCGVGCLASLPETATSFTTVELKTNFLRSARADDALRCEAVMSHAGRTTQVWDATVTRESDGKQIALFRCTQYLLGP